MRARVIYDPVMDFWIVETKQWYSLFWRCSSYRQMFCGDEAQVRAEKLAKQLLNPITIEIKEDV
jgi:hypothetical protein